VSGEGRDVGWYPDPWGTDDERYFDGSAWTRSTRHPGGLETPPDPDSAAPLSTAPAPPAITPTAPPSTPVTATPGVPPGWHPDPWAAAALRYWDGRQWTGHVSGMPGEPAPTLRLAEERTAARWARLGLAWAGPALGVSTIAGAFQWHWIADHWDEITRPGSSVDTTTNGNNGAAVLGQLAGLVFLVAGVLFLIWFYRAAVLASSSGLPSRRSPRLATASFIIPILNLWWPYQSTCDLLPQDHPGRQVVKRWWFLWIACTIGGIAVVVTAFTGAVALGITTGIVVVLALLAAIAARNVVSEIADAHDEFLART
jgi:Domain of unknown function (DUF4328)/Protein of unknown function (DUF2510)/Domain of unknown function (DUF202)